MHFYIYPLHGIINVLSLDKMLLHFMSLAFLVTRVLSNCSQNVTSDTADTSKCFMGDCVDGQCICLDGWGGSQCDTCVGRIILNESSGIV